MPEILSLRPKPKREWKKQNVKGINEGNMNHKGSRNSLCGPEIQELICQESKIALWPLTEAVLDVRMNRNFHLKAIILFFKTLLIKFKLRTCLVHTWYFIGHFMHDSQMSSKSSLEKLALNPPLCILWEINPSIFC